MTTGNEELIEFNLDFEPNPADVAAAVICGFKPIRKRLTEEETCELHGFIQETLERIFKRAEQPSEA